MPLMAAYLDNYGAGEERRNKIVFRIVAIALTLVVLGSFFWYIFRNHHEEGVVKSFLAAVRRGDFQTGYTLWGCTSQHPCSGYSYDTFVGDWGPKGDAPDPNVLGLTDSESCGDGVLLTLAVNPTRTEKLWVSRGSDSISFAPYPICPHKSPYAIMLHRTIGRLRKPLLK
jgi:hypothetical protein